MLLPNTKQLLNMQIISNRITFKKIYNTGATPNELEIRKFNFTRFKHTDNSKFSHISDSWLEWFVGFVEGAGCFSIGKAPSEQLVFQIELAAYDKEILEKKHLDPAHRPRLVEMSKKINLPKGLLLALKEVVDVKTDN